MRVGGPLFYHNGVAAQSAALGTFNSPQNVHRSQSGRQNIPARGARSEDSWADWMRAAIFESRLGRKRNRLHLHSWSGGQVRSAAADHSHPTRSEQVGCARGESFTLTVRVSGSIPLT
jgi:Ni/Co efflux regulator RcnB